MSVKDWSVTELSTQVLVIGAGGAGLRAAIAARDAGADVMVVTKGKFCDSGATFQNINGEWGYQASTGVSSRQDRTENHFQEMVDLGLGMINNELAWLVAQNAYEKFTDLQAYGVRFKSVEDKPLRVTGCFSNVERAFVTESLDNVRDSFYRVVDNRGVRHLENIEIIKLLVYEGCCVGALGVRGESEFVVISACATVLATGGGGGLFHRNLVPEGLNGDGYVLGYEAGASLINLEFIQIMLGVVTPQEDFFPLKAFLDNPKILNCFDDEFLNEYYPENALLRRAYSVRAQHAPFSCRDEARHIDIAIAKEIISGKCTPKFAITAKGERGKSGYQWPEEGLEVSYFFHSFNGGLLINYEAETGVKWLFAAGEVSGGVHGADRLGGDMMPACQVIGARAGKSAAISCDGPPEQHRARLLADVEIGRIAEIEGPDAIDFTETIDHLGWMMWKKCGIIRKEENLFSALRTINSLRDTLSGVKTKNVIERIAVEKRITLAEIILKAALRRRESRGSHYREDFPDKDDSKFGRPLITHKDNAKEGEE